MAPGLESVATGPAGQATGRSGRCPMARIAHRTFRNSKQAMAEGHTILRADASGFTCFRRCGALRRQRPKPRSSDASCEPGAFERHQRRQHNRRTLLAGARPSVSERRCHRVSTTAAGCDVGQAADDWGRSACPPQPGGSEAAVAGRGVSGRNGCGLCLGTEPGRRGLALLVARRIAECGLR